MEKYSYDRRTAAADRLYVEGDVLLRFFSVSEKDGKPDMKNNLGSLAVRDDRPLKDFIRNLENLVAQLKKHTGDVFLDH
jgi:hypothetical protein